MMNENSYMLDLRSMAGPSTMQHQQSTVTYSQAHHHHQNMGHYTHPQQIHTPHPQMEHKYPSQNIVVQPTYHQISYVHHHPLVNITQQVSHEEVVPQISLNKSKKTKSPKVRNKSGAAKILKRKPTPPPPSGDTPPPPADISHVPHAVEAKSQGRKGRKRKYAQSRQERKENMYKNLPYINSRNQQVQPKEFEDYDCKCPLKCRKRVSAEARRQEFEAFYALGSYTAQNVFLLERIKEVNKKTKIPKVGKKKTKKKSHKLTKKKNFPKMSSKYKNNSHLLSDDSDMDCKDGILEEKKAIKKIKKSSTVIPEPREEQTVVKPIEESTEERKCHDGCTNEKCSFRIPPIKNIYNYQKPIQNHQVIIESKSFQSPNDTNTILIADQKNNFYQYKNLNIHQTHSEYLGNQDQQVPNVDNNICLIQTPHERSGLSGTLSVLQVPCPTDNLQVTNSDMHNLQVGQIIETVNDPNQTHTQMTCVRIQPTQHIVYTSQHIPYAEPQIIYQTHPIQQTDDCTDQHILCSNQQDIYHPQETTVLEQDTNVFSHNSSSNIDTHDNNTKRKRKPFKTERKFTRVYHLKKIRVCREMFVKTLKISSGRVNTVLKKSRSGDGLYRKTGNQGGHNKLTEDQKTDVYNHISSMMKYMTNSTESPQPDKSLHKPPFPSGFSLKSLYASYASSNNITKHVSFTSYSRIFYKDFNPKKQTASTTTQQISNPVTQNSEKMFVVQPVKQYTPQVSHTNMNDCSNKQYTSNNTTGQMLATRVVQQEPEYANSMPSVQVYTQQVVNNSSPEGQPKKRGRKRMYGDLTRQERKYNMYRNLPYVNSRKQHVSPKQFEDFDCNCPLKCKQRISPKDRKKEFEGYYNLGSYIAQNMYLLERIEECKKKRCYVKNRPAKRERNFSRIYKLSKVRVCRAMFLKTLKISSVRVNTVLNKKRSGEELTYKRGQNQGGMNKITEEQKSAILDHINYIIESLPVDKQHNADGDLIFPQEYTFKRMYDIYLQNNDKGKSVSFSTYRRVFNEKFDFKIEVV